MLSQNNRRPYNARLGNWSAAITESISLTKEIVKRVDKCKWQCDLNHLFNKNKKHKCKCECASKFGSEYNKVNCCDEYNIDTPTQPCPNGINLFDCNILSYEMGQNMCPMVGTGSIENPSANSGSLPIQNPITTNQPIKSSPIPLIVSALGIYLMLK